MDLNKCRYGGDKPHRLIGLDILRIALALLVFLFHSRIHFQCSYGLLNNFVEMGAIAMTGFMLLSGYVLYVTYHSRNLSDIASCKIFYLKRLFAILPLYYAIAVLHIGCGLVTGKTSLMKEVVLFPVETLGLQSVFSTLFPYSHNGGTWFISCILICYLLYPFIQSMIEQIKVKEKMGLLIMLVVILLYAPIVQHLFHLSDIYSNPFFRLLEFTIGVLLANFASNSYIPIRKCGAFKKSLALLLIFSLLIVGVSVAYSVGIPHDFMLFNWVALPCFSIAIFILGTNVHSRWLDIKVIKYLSSISFTFFLCQVLPLWGICRKLVECINFDSNILKIIISFAVCFIGAVLIHELIEKPSAKYLKQKFL